MNQIEKVLSPNDTGETSTHQAGWLVPKERHILAFFPRLDPSVYNPRCVVDTVDEAGEEWTFNFIYYNNRRFGGTRNEYRLTGVTEFVRRHRLRSGDTVIFTRTESRHFSLHFRRKDSPLAVQPDGRKVLRLSGNWVVVNSG
jgi:hypothetical protein